MLGALVRLIFNILLRSLLWIWATFNIKHEERLPMKGPAIIIANHNSHFDTFALKYLLPFGQFGKIRPVAAADYFLSSGLMSWFTLNVMRIIPVKRGSGASGEDPFTGCHAALARRHILIVYPEGSRGKPEQTQEPKKGIAWLAQAHPDVPVYPICFYGLGKILPKGSFIPVPFCVEAAVGKPLFGLEDRDEFLRLVKERMSALAEEIGAEPWK